jgi:hypothetical protein
MAAVDPASVTLAYRDAMVQVAQRYFPGRVGVCIDGFAGRFPRMKDEAGGNAASSSHG